MIKVYNWENNKKSVTFVTFCILKKDRQNCITGIYIEK